MDSTPNVVAFISAKGGSGKTVTASSIGRFLARIGFKVLLIDTDASTNGLTLLFLPNVTGEKKSSSGPHFGVFDAQGNSVPTPVTLEENLAFIPATFTMSQTEDVPLGQFEDAVRRAISRGSSYDYILLDAQAGSDSYAKIAASISSRIVIVSEFDPISLQGVDRLKVLFSTVFDHSNTWVLYNKILPEFATAIGEGLVIAQVLPPIPWDADVVRAFSQRDLAINMTDPNPYTVAISQIVSRLLGSPVRQKVDSWVTQTKEARLSPVKGRLEEVELRLNSLDREKIASDFQLRMIRGIPVILFIAFFVLSGSPLLIEIIDSKNLLLPRFSPAIVSTLQYGGAVFGILAVVAQFIFRWQEKEVLVRQESIARALDDLRDERRRLKVTTDGIAVMDRKTTVQ